MAEPVAAIGEPKPFRLLLDEAAKQMRRHFRKLYPGAALPLAAANLLMLVYNVRWAQGLATVGAQADPFEILASTGGLFVAMLVLLFVQTLAYGAMGAAAVDAVAGRPIALGSRWAFVLRPRVFGSLFGMGIAVVLGTFCCLLPGIGLLLLLGFLLPVMAEEGVALGEAFRRAARLALYNPQGRIGTHPMIKILVLLVVGYLLSGAASMLVQMPFMIVQQVLTFRDLAGGADAETMVMATRWQWLSVPGGVLGSLAQTAVMVYLSLGTALLYFDVRGRREGLDLEAALDELQGPEAGLGLAPAGSEP